MSKLKCRVKMSHVIQPKQHIVIFSIRVHHAGFNSGFSLVRATDFADLSWVGVRRFVSSIKGAWSYKQCTVPVEFVFWKKCIEIVKFIAKQPVASLLDPFPAMLAKAFHDSTRLIVHKADRKVAHFANIDVGGVRVLTHPLERDRLVCSICKREAFPFLECGPDVNPT